MTSLVGTQPTDISHHNDFVMFYYHVMANRVNNLPGNAKFCVVHSPKDGNGWELVHYQMFAAQNGMAVLERRSLKADEIAYFEGLLRTSNLGAGTLPTIGAANV